MRSIRSITYLVDCKPGALGLCLISNKRRLDLHQSTLQPCYATLLNDIFKLEGLTRAKLTLRFFAN
jgi:hypothetical protein